MAREESEHFFLMFVGTGSCWTNGSSLLGNILTNENLVYSYLHFLVIYKSLNVRLSKSILFNIFFECTKCWSEKVKLTWMHS